MGLSVKLAQKLKLMISVQNVHYHALGFAIFDYFIQNCKKCFHKVKKYKRNVFTLKSMGLIPKAVLLLGICFPNFRISFCPIVSFYINIDIMNAK